MDRRAAKREARSIIAADIRVAVESNSWEEQGLMDQYDAADVRRICEQALVVAAEISRTSYR